MPALQWLVVLLIAVLQGKHDKKKEVRKTRKAGPSGPGLSSRLLRVDGQQQSTLDNPGHLPCMLSCFKGSVCFLLPGLELASLLPFAEMLAGRKQKSDVSQTQLMLHRCLFIKLYTFQHFFHFFLTLEHAFNSHG